MCREQVDPAPDEWIGSWCGGESINRSFTPCVYLATEEYCKNLQTRYIEQMSSEASRLAVSIGGVEERVSSEAKQVQAEKTHLEKQKKRLALLKVLVIIAHLK